jgi:hypothetical protein
MVWTIEEPCFEVLLHINVQTYSGVHSFSYSVGTGVSLTKAMAAGA